MHTKKPTPFPRPALRRDGPKTQEERSFITLATKSPKSATEEEEFKKLLTNFTLVLSFNGKASDSVLAVLLKSLEDNANREAVMSYLKNDLNKAPTAEREYQKTIIEVVEKELGVLRKISEASQASDPSKLNSILNAYEYLDSPSVKVFKHLNFSQSKADLITELLRPDNTDLPILLKALITGDSALLAKMDPQKLKDMRFLVNSNKQSVINLLHSIVDADATNFNDTTRESHKQNVIENVNRFANGSSLKIPTYTIKNTFDINATLLAQIKEGVTVIGKQLDDAKQNNTSPISLVALNAKDLNNDFKTVSKLMSGNMSNEKILKNGEKLITSINNICDALLKVANHNALVKGSEAGHYTEKKEVEQIIRKAVELARTDEKAALKHLEDNLNKELKENIFNGSSPEVLELLKTSVNSKDKQITTEQIFKGISLIINGILLIVNIIAIGAMVSTFVGSSASVLPGKPPELPIDGSGGGFTKPDILVPTDPVLPPGVDLQGINPVTRDVAVFGTVAGGGVGALSAGNSDQHNAGVKKVLDRLLKETSPTAAKHL